LARFAGLFVVEAVCIYSLGFTLSVLTAHLAQPGHVSHALGFCFSLEATMPLALASTWLGRQGGKWSSLNSLHQLGKVGKFTASLPIQGVQLFWCVAAQLGKLPKPSIDLGQVGWFISGALHFLFSLLILPNPDMRHPLQGVPHVGKVHRSALFLGLP